MLPPTVIKNVKFFVDTVTRIYYFYAQICFTEGNYYDVGIKCSYYHCRFGRVLSHHFWTRPLSAVCYDFLGEKMVDGKNRLDKFFLRPRTHRQFRAAGSDWNISRLGGPKTGTDRIFSRQHSSLAAHSVRPVVFRLGAAQAYQKKSHSHSHIHIAETEHSHLHSHTHEHAHIHCDQNNVNITPWVLFIVFVFGPCEPLIPLLMYPAAKNSLFDLVVVTAVFGTVTIATMLTIILLSRAGVNFVRLTKLQRFDHAIAGATILVCGLAIQLLGL